MSAKSRRALIIAVAIALALVIIGVCVFRFGFPGSWDAFWARVFHEAPLADGTLSVHFIDVGQGDGIYIAFPDGKDMIIDMGSTKGFDADSAVAAVRNLSDDNVIDYVMLTHTDQDHVAFLDEIIYAFEVRNIFMPNILAEPAGTQSSATYAEAISKLDPDKLALFTDPDTVGTNAYAQFFIAALSEENCTVRVNVDPDASTNSIVINGDSYTFTFYCPTADFYRQTHLNSAEELNAVSPVGILLFNNRRVVFTGDSNALNEPLIAERIGRIDCDVLKVAHHGSATSSCNEFLDAVDCEYAIISVGAGNSYGHPTAAALARFNARRMSIYRTDLSGDITLAITPTGNISITTEKN